MSAAYNDETPECIICGAMIVSYGDVGVLVCEACVSLRVLTADRQEPFTQEKEQE